MVEAEVAVVVYTNHRGETKERMIRPFNLRWGSNQWHPEPQWLMDALDEDIQQLRTFAVKDMRPVGGK